MRIAVVLPGLVLLGCAGCERTKPAPPPVQKVVDFGRLPGLRATTDRELRDELARLEREEATPELMTRQAASSEDNVAAGLASLFPAADLPQLLEQSAALFPSATFTFGSQELESAVQFKNAYNRQRLEARKALQRAECDFGICYTDGLDVEPPSAQAARLCARLEAFEAADCLSKSDVKGALRCGQQMLRLATCLADVADVTIRVHGAYTRTEGLAVLQEVVQQPGCRRADLEQLAATFADQLAGWPSDAKAWRGDRAMGLYAYELVRAGKADTLLTQEEAEHFQKKGILPHFSVITKLTVDRDERFYLQTMRQLIDSCSRPYYTRQKVFADLHNELQGRSQSTEYPIVAGRLLLTAVRQGQEVQAQDRANCEAWALALARATGQPAPPYQINPLTGKDFEILQEKGWVEVSNLSPFKGSKAVRVVVPDLSLQ